MRREIRQNVLSGSSAPMSLPLTLQVKILDIMKTALTLISIYRYRIYRYRGKENEIFGGGENRMY